MSLFPPNNVSGRASYIDRRKEIIVNKQYLQELFDVAGKVALISGATGGFGKAASKALAAAGAKVMMTGRTAAKLEPVDEHSQHVFPGAYLTPVEATD